MNRGGMMPEETAISAQVGKPFTVVLESVPGAGYRWKVDVDQEALELQERKHEPAFAIGGSLREQFVFLPHKPGVYVIRMRYGRPWEASTHKSKELRVSVT
jgi:predicted secreted protein